NSISNNKISNNKCGIFLDDSDKNSISNNNIYSNNCSGIYLWDSNKNSISNNICSNNWNGIDIRDSNNNSISSNICSNNRYGICLWYLNNNSISKNNISSNNWYGIYLRESNNNIIYLNNFINNGDNAYSYDSKNIWNSTEPIKYTYKGSTFTNYMGNYWSDYTGTDANEDGIGDTPYSIDSDKDNYPLMRPFENYFASPSVIEANFTSDKTYGVKPLTIKFTDLSEGEVTSWAWDFDGDGVIDSTVKNPTYTYMKSGIYNVSLTVSGPGGSDTETKNEYIRVYDKLLGVCKLTAYYCVYNSEIEGTQTYTLTIPDKRPGHTGEVTLTLKASFWFGGKGVAMEGTGRTEASGLYIKYEGGGGGFVKIGSPLWKIVKRRYDALDITDFTGFGGLALSNPQGAKYSVREGVIGASGRELIPWYSIAAPRKVKFGTIGGIEFLRGETISPPVTPDEKTWMLFRVDDRGGAIKGRKIDVYVGEGEEALSKWYETGGNRIALVYCL
ncbi:hypothetical protein DRJ16_07165, partial [Candidatus Woesearchaeota archaeon]